MNLNIKLSEEQMMERQQNIARLKENEWIQIFLEQNHLDRLNNHLKTYEKSEIYFDEPIADLFFVHTDKKRNIHSRNQNRQFLIL